MELNPRTRQVLMALIHSYIDTGGPVASRTVARKSNLNLSPATVRNILADLHEMGYLTQPHASAGRVPSDLGYRFYVDSLLAEGGRGGQANSDISQIAARYRTSSLERELSVVFQKTSHILSEESQYIGLVLAPNLSNAAYSHMECVRIRRREFLVILISQSSIVHNRIISTDLDLSQEALDELTDDLNQELCGLTLEQVRERVVEKMNADRRLYRELLNKVFLSDELSEAHDDQNRIFLEGTPHILDHPEFANLERMKRILQAIEKKSILVGLLDKSIDVEGVMVYIGSENPLQVLKDCSLVAANYRFNNRVAGTLGVIGPKRMDYSRVIPIVDRTAELLSNTIGS